MIIESKWIGYQWQPYMIFHFINELLVSLCRKTSLLWREFPKSISRPGWSGSSCPPRTPCSPARSAGGTGGSSLTPVRDGRTLSWAGLLRRFSQQSNLFAISNTCYVFQCFFNCLFTSGVSIDQKLKLPTLCAAFLNIQPEILVAWKKKTIIVKRLDLVMLNTLLKPLLPS